MIGMVARIQNFFNYEYTKICKFSEYLYIFIAIFDLIVIFIMLMGIKTAQDRNFCRSCFRMDYLEMRF